MYDEFTIAERMLLSVESLAILHLSLDDLSRFLSFVLFERVAVFFLNAHCVLVAYSVVCQKPKSTT